MTTRSTRAGLAAAFILGLGTFVGGSLATSTSAEAAPGWHGRPHHHGHFGHRGWHRGPHWGYRGVYRGPVYARGYYGVGCYRVMRPRFVPGVGRVVRPVTICR